MSLEFEAREDSQDTADLGSLMDQLAARVSEHAHNIRRTDFNLRVSVIAKCLDSQT